MLRQVNRFEILPLIDVVESDIERNQRVKVQLLEFVHSVLDRIDNTRSTLLLPIEGAHCALSLESFLDEADNVLRFLLTGQLFLFAAEGTSKQDVHVELTGQSLCLKQVALLRICQLHELNVG